MGEMKEKFVLAVMAMLLCSCLSFGNGDERVYKARKSFYRSYVRLRPSLQNPDAFPHKATVFQYLREVQGKEKKWHHWVKKISGYSHEQLSNPPESFMNEDVLKLATDYHLWRAGWYLVRFITLHKAAERDRQLDEKYPSTCKCKTLALEAYQLSEDHKKKYLRCYKALSETAQKDVMKQIGLPNYIASQEVEHKYPEIGNCVDSQWQNHKSEDSDAILNVKAHMGYLINRLLRRKASVNFKAAKRIEFIRSLLAPSGMKLNADMMSSLTTYFSVEDLSTTPDKSSRSDQQFLEVAMLFNKYRSLWHEIRYKEFLQLLPQLTGSKSRIFFKRLKGAIKSEKENFKHYELLSESYYEILIKYQTDSTAIVQNTLPQSDFTQSHIFGNEAHEQIRWKGKRKRAAFRRARKSILQGTDASPENKSLRVVSDSVRSDSPLLDQMQVLEMVATEVNCPTGKQGVHKAKRYKCLEEVNIQMGFYREEPCKSSKDQSDCDLPAAGLSNEVEQRPLFMKIIQHCTLEVSADFNPGLGTNDNLARKHRKSQLIVSPTEPTIMQNALKRPKLDLNLALPEAEGDLCLADVQPELHSNLVPCAKKDNQQLHNAIMMDPIAPKRLDFTPSEENHFRRFSNLDGAHLSSPEGFSRTIENSYSTSKYKFYNFL